MKSFLIFIVTTCLVLVLDKVTHAQTDQCDLVDVRPLDGGSPLMVIDNFMDYDILHQLYIQLTLSLQWKPQSSLHREEFAQWEEESFFDRLFYPSSPDQKGGFPGLVAELSKAYSDAFHQELQRYQDQLTEVFDIANKDDKGDVQLLITPFSFFANVCYHPDSLLPVQSIPHMDRGFNNRGTHQYDSLSLAMVHYINPNYKGTGGTAMYKERVTNSSRFNAQDCQNLMKKAAHSSDRFQQWGCHCLWPSLQTDCRERVQRIGNQQGYGRNISEHYELLEHASYVFNRLVIYDPNQLHSAYIDNVDDLTCSPKDGRLTTNLFLI